MSFREDGAALERARYLERLFLSHTRLNDRYVIRLAVGNERRTEDDVRRAWEALRGAAAGVASPPTG